MAIYKGRTIMQEPQDLVIWDKFFAENPVKTVIELGTGHGGMALYFGLKCRDVGAQFYTFDNIQSTDFAMPIEQEINLAASFKLIDIFSDAGKSLIGGIIQNSPKPLLIFFDNGNKPLEWSLFAPLTSPNDFCVVHDWDTEFFAKDVGSVSVERILCEESDARGKGWKAMWFKRV
jgi:cephalosporin hydroxylase